MLPTPIRAHYLFNTRDLTKLFQGILSINFDVAMNTDQFYQLFIHEMNRIFYDRLINKIDQDYFINLVIK